MAEAEVTGPGVTEMKLLAARLKEADPKLKRELRKNFRDAAEPVIGDVEQSILLWPSHHDGTLRREIIKTVGARTSFSSSGVRVSIDSTGSKMPPGKGTLPHHIDSDKGWNHPVYARGDRFTLRRSRARKYRHLKESLKPLVKQGAWTWTHQLGKPGWFEKPQSISGSAVLLGDLELRGANQGESSGTYCGFVDNTVTNNCASQDVTTQPPYTWRP